ncbi:hypothetical protein RSAG8_09573, partial [Rhizoctonia solani AG-8 WAC10335]
MPISNLTERRKLKNGICYFRLVQQADRALIRLLVQDQKYLASNLHCDAAVIRCDRMDIASESLTGISFHKAQRPFLDQIQIR